MTRLLLPNSWSGPIACDSSPGSAPQFLSLQPHHTPRARLQLALPTLCTRSTHAPNTLSRFSLPHCGPSLLSQAIPRRHSARSRRREQTRLWLTRPLQAPRRRERPHHCYLRTCTSHSPSPHPVLPAPELQQHSNGTPRATDGQRRPPAVLPPNPVSVIASARYSVLCTASLRRRRRPRCQASPAPPLRLRRRAHVGRLTPLHTPPALSHPISCPPPSATGPC
jgi:hypothetical protein